MNSAPWLETVLNKSRKHILSIALGTALAITPSWSKEAEAQPKPIIVEKKDAPTYNGEDELILETASGVTLKRAEISLDPYMININTHTLSGAIHHGLNSLIARSQQKPLFLRTVFVGVGLYLDSIVNTLSHELGHYGEARTIGIKGGTLRLENLWRLDADFSYDDGLSPYYVTEEREAGQLMYRFHDNPYYQASSTEKMAVSGRGLVMETALASKLLMEGIIRDRSMEPLEMIAYIDGHSSLSRSILLASVAGRLYNPSPDHGDTTYSDVNNYNFHQLVNYYMPVSYDDPAWLGFSDQQMESYFNNRSENIQRPPRGLDAALYNFRRFERFLDTGENRTPHLLGIGVFNALDPYTLHALYGVGKYLATGNNRLRLLPSSVPQFNGYLAVPGPQYEVRWYIPITGGLLITSMRLGIDPSSAAAFGIGIHDLTVPFTSNLRYSVSGEIIQQDDYSALNRGTTAGGMLQTKIDIPLKDRLIFSPYLLYKSGGVWTPYMFGLNDDYIFGLQLKVRL